MLKKIFNNKIIKNFVLAFIISILIITLFFWWLKSYTNHGEKIETPNFIELSISDAQNLAKEKSLLLVIDSVFMPGKTKGSILLQNPIANSDTTPSFVKPNRKIYLTSVKTSTQLIKLPNIDASEMIVIPRLSGRFNFEKEYIEGDSKVLKVEYNGKKVNTGDLIPRGSKLILFIGQESIKEPVLLPNLVGLTLNEANTKVSDKSLKINAIIYNNCITKEDSTSAIIAKQPDFKENKNVLKGSEVLVIMDKKVTK